MTRTLRGFLTLPIALLFFVSGCGDDPSGTTPDDGDVNVAFGGSFEDGDVVLERIVGETPEGPVAIDLVARAVRVVGEVVEVDVAMRNESRRPIGIPALVFIGDFTPPTVRVTNSDNQLVDGGPGSLPPAGPYPDWFDYSASFGDDQVLTPGEPSSPRTWRFEVPGAVSFAFGAEAQLSLTLDGPTISGRVFDDRDADGDYGDDELPFGAGMVQVQASNGEMQRARVDSAGRWRVALRRAGLYDVRYLLPPVASPVPMCVTTPNPLEVIITADENGEPNSFTDADFGVHSGPDCGDPPPLRDAVILTSQPPDSIESDPYSLINARVIASPGAPDGQTTYFVEVTVGFSGCGPDHPVVAYAGDDFMDTNPPSTWLRLAHDDRGELCEAWFEEMRLFDLTPLVREYRSIYGDEVDFTMELTGPDGQTFQLSVP